MLHTVNRSPYASNMLTLCLRYASPKSVILLMEDAVIAGIEDGTWLKTLLSCEHYIYLLQEDVIARGLEKKISSNMNLIDINGFVALTEQHNQHIKW